MEAKHNYINGKWISSSNGNVIEVTNPATLEVIATVPKCGQEEARSAVEAAAQAFPEWRERSAYERSELLFKWYSLIMDNKDTIARTMTLEQGKPLSEAEGETVYAAQFIQWYAEEAKRVYGETIPASSADKRIFVARQPVGVVAAITPWNFPAAMITRKAGPALAAGCPIIIKPASQTPLTALLLAKFVEEAGFPPGVFNVITGSAKEINKVFMEEERVRKVTFTGSTEVGKEIMKGAADTMKKLSLELGGHAPVIVLNDADAKLAARQTVLSKFRNAGQTCVCANRIYVQDRIYDTFEKELAAETAKLKVGNGLEESITIGPLIDQDGFRKVEEHVKDAVSHGARIITGGQAAESAGSSNGYFFEPTILSGVTSEMRILHEETFGPVAPLIRFQDEAEAVRQANDSPYGLAAYLFTANINHAVRIAEQLEFGIIGINDGAPSSVQAPFGGFKQSGLGREGGHHGLDEYLEVKYISLGLHD